MNIRSNAPEGYECPICIGLQAGPYPKTLIKGTDFVYRDGNVSALINTFFMGKNAGHVIVVPNEHFESLYTLPPEVGHQVFDVVKMIAIAMKRAYQCDGIKLLQNNEPAADQHAFHYHHHVVPRYDNDGFNLIQPSDKRLAEPEERAGYAQKIKAALDN